MKITKEPWQMTQEEYEIHYLRSRAKAHEMYGKPAGKTLDIAQIVETADEIHENIIKDALQKGFPVPIKMLKDYPDLMPVVVEKEPWQMTQDEFLESNIVHGLGKRVSIKDIPPKSREALIRFHQKHISDALAEGKLVPKSVLAEYPDLQMQIPHKTVLGTRKIATKLPPDAQNVQTLPFDSQLFDCYGKQTKRGFRAYCRRKK